MWLCRFLFLFHLHFITAQPKTVLNESHGKVYMYFEQSSTREELVKICKANNMNLLSVEQRVEQSWLKSFLGRILGIKKNAISTVVCEKNYVSRINNFTRRATFSSPVSEISSLMMVGNRMECAIQCSDIIECVIFTYASNACQFYSNHDMLGGTQLQCGRSQCYVKM